MLTHFDKGTLGYRLKHLQGRNELIAKAIGWKKDLPLKVFDVTAGLGKESFILAALGCTVTLFERNPSVIEILSNSLNEAKNNPELSTIVQRMKLMPQCAIEYFTHNTFDLPDVIYCDPMFEPRLKTALVKKDIRHIQSLVGVDNDSSLLVSLSIPRALKRVVVKRSKSAPYLAGSPHHSFNARSHRFDIYLGKGIS